MALILDKNSSAPPPSSSRSEARHPSIFCCGAIQYWNREQHRFGGREGGRGGGGGGEAGEGDHLEHGTMRVALHAQVEQQVVETWGSVDPRPRQGLLRRIHQPAL